MEEDNRGDEIKSKGHIALEITQLEPTQEDPIITFNIRKELEAVSFPCCIFRVPTKFRIQKEDAYEPTMVSIGPFHHGKSHLQHMENDKWKYLNSLLDRNLTLEATLDSCIQALKELEPKIRGCYQENLSHIPSDKFLTMILLDAGFIIELFLRSYVRGLRTRDDTLFKTREKLHVLANDLILLENQIPFFVLRKIFSLVMIPKERNKSISELSLSIPKESNKSISELSLKFFKHMILGEIHILHEKYSFEGSNHLLDLIWKCYLPTFHKPLSIRCSSGDIQSASQFQESGIEVPLSIRTLSRREIRTTCSGREIQSASELQDLGIRIKGAEAESILDVIFVKGKLLIPSLRIRDHSHMETVLRNLIALEHCYGAKMKYVTSYAYLMRGLLQSEKDVKLFYQQRILLDYVKHKKKVVDLFKSLCGEVDLEDFYYEVLWKQVQEMLKKIKECKRTKLGLWCYKLKSLGIWSYKLKEKGSLHLLEENGRCQITLVLLFVVFVLLLSLLTILYLFFRHERHAS